MKSFEALSALSLSLVVLLASSASFADEQKFVYDGTRPSEELALKSQQTHTLYEDRTFETTCYREEQQGTREEVDGYREEQDGYREECTGGSAPVCTNERSCDSTSEQVCRGMSPHQECTPVTGTRCSDHESCSGGSAPTCTSVPNYRQVPTYRTVPNMVQIPYSCTKTETVAVGEAVDFNVKANVKITFDGAAPAGAHLAENFVAKLDGASLELSTGKLTNQVLFLAKKTVQETVQPKDGAAPDKILDVAFDISVLPLSALNGPVTRGISDVKLDASQVSFLTGRITRPENLAVALKLSRVLLLKRNPLLIQSVFPAEALTLTDSGTDRTRVTIDLTKLKLKETIHTAKYETLLKLKVTEGTGDRKLLNPQSLGDKGSVTKKTRIKLKITKKG